MRQSVKLRARAIETPPLDAPALQLRGAGCFRQHCQQCHGGPGQAPALIGLSMQPLPGPLVDARQLWEPRELYWLTRHGIKMSGMPAWELRLSDAEIWSVVAFMQQLPELDAATYAALPATPSCGRERGSWPATRAGDAKLGLRATYQYGCNSCHAIPGVAGADPRVGPPLAGLASRSLIAGMLPNNAANRARWLRETHAIKPGTAMPELGVTAQDAEDIAAYLGTLH